MKYLKTIFKNFKSFIKSALKIKSGVTRIVITVFPKYVIKISHPFNGKVNFLYGCLGNAKERDFCKKWKGMSELNQVAPSIFCSWFGLFQIQYKCSEYIIENPDVNKVKENLNNLTFIFGNICEDIKIINFGVLNGKVVCLDYAN